ncbi:hypothetical protein LTR93_011756 [Exophiala xenobiotica]|nr:hypothetical protein LTR93_011756 [Exophiala xenobiotica]
MCVTKTLKIDVPDHIINTATIPTSETVAEDATFLFLFRRGRPFPSEPALVWTINDERGEIQLVSPASFALHATAYSSRVTIEVHNIASDHVEDIEWSWSAWQKDLPIASRNVGALSEASADHKDSPLQTFESASRRLEQVHGMLATIGERRK